MRSASFCSASWSPLLDHVSVVPSYRCSPGLCVCLQENVSLADVLSLRDSCLSEEEVWAVCAECVLALQSIRPSHLFHTLCITPDTLAFNAHGNVCFMEQLSGESTSFIFRCPLICS